MATVYVNCDDVVAHLPGVVSAVRREAKGLGKQAKRRLAAHKETGAAQVEVTHDSPDSFVSLIDPAALSIEYGRGAYTRGDGAEIGPMQGLHILGGLL